MVAAFLMGLVLLAAYGMGTVGVFGVGAGDLAVGAACVDGRLVVGEGLVVEFVL
jgi:hypothetical protein